MKRLAAMGYHSSLHWQGQPVQLRCCSRQLLRSEQDHDENWTAPKSLV